MFECYNEDCNCVELQEEGNDCRQEWEQYFYSCPNCGKTYTRTIRYKTQSRLIKSDEMVDDETGKIVE